MFIQRTSKNCKTFMVLPLDCCLKMKIFGTDLTELECEQAVRDDLGFLFSSSDE